MTSSSLRPSPAPPPPPEFDSLSDAFAAALKFENNKPDSKSDLLLLSSPVSTLPNPTPASSSSSSSSSAAATADDGAVGLSVRRSRSGEIPLFPAANSHPGHRRSGSGPLIFTGSGINCTAAGGGSGTTATSPAVANVLPTGNICPPGRVVKASPTPPRAASRSDVLGSGTGNYGHGSVIRGRGIGVGEDDAAALRRAIASGDPEEVRRAGNEQYRKGHFEEALRLYDRAIAMCPDSAAACRCNRAAALIGLRRLAEAVRECENAIRLDPAYGRAHQRLASLLLRLGQINDARRHLMLAGQQLDPLEMHKLQVVEKHLGRCAEARRNSDWNGALRESDAAITAGVDLSSLLFASRAESLLQLHRLDEAETAITSSSKIDYSPTLSMDAKFCGFFISSYVLFVHAQVEMALGRFDNAVAMVEKARKIDPGNGDVIVMSSVVKSVARARATGNELFNSGKFAEASLAYGEGLKCYSINPVLYCNRAACYFKLGQWEKSISDCNEALSIQPSYTKALLRRAASYDKVERWAESVRDYEVLRKQLPSDTDLAEAHFHAQVALKTSRGEEVSNLKFGGAVEEIANVEQFQIAINLPGVTVIHFTAPSNLYCSQIMSFVNSLRMQYPSVNFLKVNVSDSPAVAKAENVRTVPTFKIYKNGIRVKEMICPSQQLLDYTLRHYGL